MLNALTAQLSKCYLCIKDITQYTYLLGHTVCLGVGLEGGVEGLRLPWDRQGIQVYRERDKLKDYQGLQTYLLLSTYVADYTGDQFFSGTEEGWGEVARERGEGAVYYFHRTCSCFIHKRTYYALLFRPCCFFKCKKISLKNNNVLFKNHSNSLVFSFMK